MAFYRVTVYEEIEEEPSLIKSWVLDSGGVDFANYTSLDGKQIMPCLNVGSLITKKYFDEIIPLLNLTTGDIFYLNNVSNFIPIERTQNRVDDLKIKRVSIRGVVEVLANNIIG